MSSDTVRGRLHPTRPDRSESKQAKEEEEEEKREKRTSKSSQVNPIHPSFLEWKSNVINLQVVMENTRGPNVR